MLGKYLWIQILYNVYFTFDLQDQYSKNTIMFYWPNNCAVAALPRTPLASVAQLVVAQGVG